MTRTVVVTGAASGIGRQLARDLVHHDGDHVLLIDIDAVGLAALAAELGAAARTHVLDVTDAAAVAALADVAGDIDALVNCAGVLYLGPFAEMPGAELERVIAVNLLGTMRVTRALLPRLLAAAAPGRRPAVVVISSAAAFAGTPGMAAYCASKHALLGFSEALRVEVGDRLGVSAVCPSVVRTRIVASATGPAAEKRASFDRFLQRIGSDPEKVSAAIRGALRRPRPIIPVNPDAHLLYHAHRILPGLTERLVAGGYRLLRKRGLLAR